MTWCIACLTALQPYSVYRYLIHLHWSANYLAGELSSAVTLALDRQRVGSSQGYIAGVLRRGMWQGYVARRAAQTFPVLCSRTTPFDRMHASDSAGSRS